MSLGAQLTFQIRAHPYGSGKLTSELELPLKINLLSPTYALRLEIRGASPTEIYHIALAIFHSKRKLAISYATPTLLKGSIIQLPLSSVNASYLSIAAYFIIKSPSLWFDFTSSIYHMERPFSDTKKVTIANNNNPL